MVLGTSIPGRAKRNGKVGTLEIQKIEEPGVQNLTNILRVTVAFLQRQSAVKFHIPTDTKMNTSSSVPL